MAVMAGPSAWAMRVNTVNEVESNQRPNCEELLPCDKKLEPNSEFCGKNHV